MCVNCSVTTQLHRSHPIPSLKMKSKQRVQWTVLLYCILFPYISVNFPSIPSFYPLDFIFYFFIQTVFLTRNQRIITHMSGFRVENEVREWSYEEPGGIELVYDSLPQWLHRCDSLYQHSRSHGCIEVKMHHSGTNLQRKKFTSSIYCIPCFRQCKCILLIMAQILLTMVKLMLRW